MGGRAGQAVITLSRAGMPPEGGPESQVLRPGQVPAVSGRLAGHAGDPGAAVAVRTGSASVESSTGPDGAFRAVPAGFDGLAGTHVAGMLFPDGERMGAAGDRPQVSCTMLRSAELARQL